MADLVIRNAISDSSGEPVEVGITAGVISAVVAERVKLEMAGSFSLGAQHNPMFLTDRDT